MSNSSDNPCASCSIDQDCCTHLSGLRVTAAEFERCFAAHADRLDIEHEGPVVVLTPKNHAPCPNWQQAGCAVYEDRPRECRLFPFTLYVRKPNDDLVSIGYHSDTRCPLKTTLLPADCDARAIVTSFAEEAFPGLQVEITRESTFERFQRRTKECAWKSLAAVTKHFARSHPGG